MAKKTISTKKSLKSLFSKSEANLKESVEKDDSGKGIKLNFFKWKKKRKTESATDISEKNVQFSRTEPATLEVCEGQDEEKGSGHKPSLFGTAPRSKKGLLSYSESDLRKPKSFGTFHLGWKKKRKRDLAQSLSSVPGAVPGVKGHISEHEEFEEQVEKELTLLHHQDGFQVVEATPVSKALPRIANQSQPLDIMSDMFLPNDEGRLEDAVLAAGGFMPPHVDSSLIPYIDSSVSDSDGYQTPPESPVPNYLSFDYTAAQAVTREYPAPAESYITDSSRTFSRRQATFAQMDDHEPVIITDTLKIAEFSPLNTEHVEAVFSSTYSAANPTATAVDRSIQYSSSVLFCTSEAKHEAMHDITDSVSRVPKMETTANSDTCSVDNSNTGVHLNLNCVSGRDDNSLFYSNSETHKSGITADVEVKTFTTDIAPNINTLITPEESYLDCNQSKDVTSTINQSSFSSNPNSTLSSILDCSSSSIHQSSNYSISQSSDFETPESAITADVVVKTFTTDIASYTNTMMSPKDLYMDCKVSKDVTSSIPQSSLSSIHQSSISISQSFDSVTTESTSTANVEVKTFTTDTDPNIDPMITQKESYLDCNKSKDVISTTPQNSISSLPQSSLFSIHQSYFPFIPQSSNFSIPLSSSSSILQSTTSSIPPMSTSVIPESFTSNSNNVISRIPTSKFDSDSKLLSNIQPNYIISTEAEVFKTSPVDNRDLFVTNSDILVNNTDPHIRSDLSITTNTSKPISVSSMPDVIVSSSVSSSSNIENSVDADTDTKLISSFCNADVSALSSVHCNLLVGHYTPASSSLEQTCSDNNSKIILMESPQTANYSYSTYATDSDKPIPAVVGPVCHNAEPVLLENESNISLPQSVLSRVHTTINSTKTATFDLIGLSDPVIPDPSWRGLSKNMTYSDMATLSEISAQERINQEIDQAKSTSSHEIVHSSSDFPHHVIFSPGVSTSEAISTSIIHPSSYSEISHQLVRSVAPEVELDKQLKIIKTYEVCEEDQPYVTEVNFVNDEKAPSLEQSKNHELFGQGETAAGCMTKLNDPQMFVKEKYGPEEEEKNGLNDIYNKDETASKCTTTVNDLQMLVNEKYASEEEERNRLDEFYNKNYEVTSIQEKDIKSEQSMRREKSIDVLELRCVMDEKSRTWMSHEAQEQMLLHKVIENYEGVEGKMDGLQVVQSMREASKTQGEIELEAELCGDTEVLTVQAEQQIPFLAPLKPALPVIRECGPEECTLAPPSSELVKVSFADSSMVTLSHLETWLHPSAQHQSSGEITPLEDTSRSKYQITCDKYHVETKEHIHSKETKEIATFFTSRQNSECQEPNSAETESTVWQSTLGIDKISTIYAGEDFIHSKDASNKQGEVTVTKVKTATDNISTFTHRNVVQISETTAEDRREEEDVITFPDHQLATRFIPGDRFLHASTVLSTVIEESETETESDIDMNSAVAVLSTTLNRPSSTGENREDVMMVRKVSMVRTENNGSSGNYESPLDSFGLRDQSEQTKASPELRRRWNSLHSSSEEKKSSFLESSDYKLTDRTYLHSSQLSPSYETTVYTSHFHSPGTLETQPTAFFSETAGSLGNSSWKVRESEVQISSESNSSGRSGVEHSTPARVREGEREQIRKESFDSQASLDTSLIINETDESFTGVYLATRVELPSSPDTPDTPSTSSLSEIDSLVDTLKSMDRPIRQRVQRTPSNTPFSSLPPIEEDTPISSPTPVSAITEPKKILNGVSNLPPDIGLNWSSPKDMRSPLTMMKEQQSGDSPSRGLTLPLRASALSSIVMRRSSLNDPSTEEGSTTGLVNGGGLLSPSRLENSLLFQPTENGKTSNRSIFRATSLPDIGNSYDRISSAPKGTDALLGPRFERFSYLTSPSSSLSGIAETSRKSMPPSMQQNSGTETSSFNHKPSLELYRFMSSESLLKNSQPPGLQRSSSVDVGFLMNDTKPFQMNQKQEPEQNVALKYRAFPDAYLTKEKEHGKLNPRPGKMLIYDQPGLTGQSIEVRGDVVDATPWEFTDIISIRVIRGGWVLYEKPDFKGEKIALDEGDIELSNPFKLPDEEEVHEQNGTAQDNGEEDQESKPLPKRKSVIGSIRRAVRDYSVPEISLFPEENADGKKITFRDTSDDARIFGFPIKANSIIVNAGLWLVFAEPFFQGVPRVLEVGGFPNPAAWGVTHPYVSSLHPLKIGEPKVENLYEPKIVIYEKPYFTGKSREIYTSMKDFMTRVERQQSLFMYSAGSIKVIGGCWVGYEKEGFRGHQYLLEEGDYHDWRVWGADNSELRSVRVIHADLSEPMLVLFGSPEEENEGEEEPTFEVKEAVTDVEVFGFGINTRSIHVLRGAWVAYSHVDFSGNQYILEKGFYNNCGDWGSGDNRICSLQPILPAPSEGPIFRNEVLLYSKANFQGTCRVCLQNQGCLPENLIVKSCRVVGGSWVLYERDRFTGNQYVLSEGDYPNLTSMGCQPDCYIRSLKAVPMTFSVPSISLFGRECFEGREVTFDMQVPNMQEEGFNTQYFSVKVNSGCWVLCEHSNYRGRQFLLEPVEITNWYKFSSLSNIGSLYPVRQKKRLFRIRNKETGHYVSVQGGVEDMKTGRVVVSEQVEGMSDVWLYQDGLIKNKLAQSMSLQVVGNVDSGAKVVLWTESRVPAQTWSAQVSGKISSVNFPGMVLDIKGGKTYDRQHLVIQKENEEHGSQQWELEFV
ncbi:uncharacterized protein LOC127619479 [Xyrauchen texanus]|uniref:uncharacterized protein LOC127619479 n=1 Tax=Xyrauchen texanus TaxID=154827 RepID=UPI002241B687|nr:uncharacterized protein LOC127619479 [Xyrauchen texanus]